MFLADCHFFPLGLRDARRHKTRNGPSPVGDRGRQPQGLLPVWLVAGPESVETDSRRESWFLQVMPFFLNDDSEAELGLYSTSRRVRRRFIRSRAWTTSALSRMATRRCSVNVASRGYGELYSPRMRLAMPALPHCDSLVPMKSASSATTKTTRPIVSKTPGGGHAVYRVHSPAILGRGIS